MVELKRQQQSLVKNIFIVDLTDIVIKLHPTSEIKR